MIRPHTIEAPAEVVGCRVVSQSVTVYCKLSEHTAAVFKCNSWAIL